jgi:sigma-B regulation protein RsbU (phosphoserine phosphatase)
MKKKKRTILKKSIIVFCIAILFALILSGFLSYKFNVNQIEQKSAENSLAGASIASQVIENINFDKLQKSDTSELYIETRNTFRSICKNFDLEYLYLYVPNVDKNYVRYIMTVASDDDKDRTVATERGLNVTVDCTLSEQELSALGGKTDESFFIENNSYGNVYSWFYPVQNSDGDTVALIGCDYKIDWLYTQIFKETLTIILPMIVALVFIFIIFVVFMNKKVFAPIKLISNRMNSFVADREAQFQPLNINSGDEIQEIANSFEKMSEDINTYIDRIQNLITESVQAKVQMDVANHIQVGIVPPEKIINDDNFNIFGYAKPAKEVGGDFYDCFVRGDSSVCFFIGDVSGKGIGAALFMAMVKTMLKDSLNYGLSPATALNEVNNTLCKSNPEGMFATVFVVVLDLETGALQYANAGHNKPIIIGDKAEFLEIDSGIALGLFENADIIDCSINLKNNSGILLYTDGVTDTINQDKKFFGENRLLSAVTNTHSAKATVKTLNKSVKAFSQGSEQFDDYTVLSLFYNKTAREKFTFAPKLSSLDEFRDVLFNNIGDDVNKKKIYLACEEVLVNIISYSKATVINVKLKQADDKLSVVFLDDGISFNPLCEDSKEKEFEAYENGGMGISIVKNIATVTAYARQDGFNIFTLEFHTKKCEK